MNPGRPDFAKLGGGPQTIAVIRALPGLGDFLCFVPTLRALRSAFPSAQITLIGLPQTQTLVERFQTYLTNWLPFPGFPGIPEVAYDPHQTAAALVELRQQSFDLALQLHGSGSCINPFVQQIEAKITAGCFPANQPCPDPDWFLPYPEQEPEIWRSLRLLQFLGIPLQGDELEFPLRPVDWQNWRRLAAVHQLNRPYVCLHPGASQGDKCWRPEHFAAVADALAAQGWMIVLTGSASEARLTGAVAAQMRAEAIDLAGQTELGELAVLLKQSRLLICNDTGLSHLAAALKLNSVVIFSNTDSQRWAPLDRDRHRVVGGWTDGRTCYPTSALVLETALALLHRELVYAY